MNINELKPRQGSIELVAEVVEKGDIREFNKFGKAGRVCNAKLKDDTGTIALTLWNEQIDQVKVGDKIQIKNGYASEWQGEIQLTTGKFGTLEVVGASDAPAEPAATEPAPAEKPAELKPETPSEPEAPEEMDVEEEKVE